LNPPGWLISGDHEAVPVFGADDAVKVFRLVDSFGDLHDLCPRVLPRGVSAGRLDLPAPDVGTLVDRLPIQIVRLNTVAVDKAEAGHSGREQVLEHDRTDSPQAENGRPRTG